VLQKPPRSIACSARTPDERPAVLTLWIILTALVALVAVALAIPLVRRFELQPTDTAPTLAVLADELAEIDAQAARGSIAAGEAEALRTEVKRRMLAEGRVADAPRAPLAAGTTQGMAFALAGLVALSAGGIYLMLGRSDLGITALDAPAVPVQQAAADPGNAAADAQVAQLVQGLQAKLKTDPNNAEGWRMLGWSQFNLQNFTESAAAYARAVALTPAAPGYQSAYGEALVQAADGTVTPVAQAAFTAAAKLDPADARARYFLGVHTLQAGNPRAAIAGWLQLLQSAPADAPWAGELRGVIERAAAQAGVDISADLAQTAAPAGAIPAPSADQAAAVSALPRAEQQAFIRSMVDGLAARLATNPKDAQGWQRLMRARTVLGDKPGAAAAYTQARAAFQNDPATLATLADAAKTLNIAI
jgi:cytochrome c-type biogenesis protein CcmH